MVKWAISFFESRRRVWLLVAVLALLNAAGIYGLVSDYQADQERAAQVRAARLAELAKPKPPPPPIMIHPPAVSDMLQSGTLIVISKKTQNMFVFNDGVLWASAPISTGKRRHETPSGVFPILQKRKFHRSNLYSNAPMPFMQRLTWDGIALHAGRVPGYAASHGCVRLPHGVAEALFKLTNMKATTVVIGDAPLESDFHAQQFALSAPATLPIRSALAPPPDASILKSPMAKTALAFAQATTVQPGEAGDVKLAGAPLPGAPRIAPPAAPPSATPPPPPQQPAPLPPGSQTIQLTAAASEAEAEAHWAKLLRTRPDLSRFQKRVEPATVNARLVYRLRISGANAHGYCAKLKAEGGDCLVVG